MLLDSNLAFDGNGTTPVAITVSRASTNVIDLRNFSTPGSGEPLAVTVIGNGLFAAAGAATLVVGIEGSVDNSAWTTYMSSPALSIAALNSRVIGQQPYVLGLFWPDRTPGSQPPRYLRLNYTVATGPFTAGAVHAFLNLGRDELQAFPRNYSVAYV
jgi:hypothetical protein